MTLRFTELAVADLLEAREHYREIDDQLELRFLDQVDQLVDRLLAFPNGATPVDGFPGIRRARMRQFSYGFFYRLEAGEVVVLRVLHSRRGTSSLA